MCLSEYVLYLCLSLSLCAFFCVCIPECVRCVCLWVGGWGRCPQGEEGGVGVRGGLGVGGALCLSICS